MRARLLLALALAGAFAACTPRSPESGPSTAGDLADYGETSPFNLVDQSGARFSSDGLRGKAVLVFFGYTSCPDVCPMTLSRIETAYRLLGDLAAEAQTVLITVDPATDDPPTLAAYLDRYSIHAIGLTGSEDELAAVRKAWGAFAGEPHGTGHGGHTVDHSSQLFLVDRDGRLRRLFSLGDPASAIAAGVRAVLSES